MKKMVGLSLGIILLSAGSGLMLAQTNPDGTTNPPKVLIIQREFLKPGKAGSLHEKSEAAFVRAMQEAKWPQHYFALNSMSGPSRALFILAYKSFADAEKDNTSMAHNKVLSEAFDRAAIADGDLLSGYDSSAWTYDEDTSQRASVKIEQMRYMEMTVIRIKPGHIHEWNELAKMYKDGFADIPTAHWATFDNQYGRDLGDAFLIVSPMASLSEVDQELADQKSFVKAMGPDGMKKLSEMSADCIVSIETNLFEISPKMSYPPADWVDKNPDFWRPKEVASTKKEASKKETAKAAQ